MRRVLHVPAMDIREGDLISFSDLWEIVLEFDPSGDITSKDFEGRVVESRPTEDGDYDWYLSFGEDSPFNQFCEPFKQFTLLLDL